MKDIMQKLLNAQSKYVGVIGSVESELSDKIEFEFAILWQDSDGFIVFDIESSANAPLRSCLDVIKLRGKLTHDDYMNLTI